MADFGLWWQAQRDTALTDGVEMAHTKPCRAALATAVQNYAKPESLRAAFVLKCDNSSANQGSGEKERKNLERQDVLGHQLVADLADSC